MKPIHRSVVAIACLFSTFIATEMTFAQTEDPCVRLRMGLDIGSGGTKARTAIMNICTQSLIVYIDKESDSIAFKEELDKAVKSGEKKIWKPEFLNAAREKIKGIVSKLAAKTKAKLATDKFKAYSAFADAPIQVAAVATQAFRESENTKDFVTLMAKEGIRVNVISQDEEGHLGFLGALAVLGSELNKPMNSGSQKEIKLNPTQMITWDIGGGSLQFSSYEGTQENSGKMWSDFGNKLASVPMRIHVFENFFKKPWQINDIAQSPNPLLSSRLEFEDGRAQRKLLNSTVAEKVNAELASLVQEGWISRKIQKGSVVYGIGGVHFGALSALRKTPGMENATGYSVRDLSLLLDTMVKTSDADLVKNFGVPDKIDILAGAVTNVLLVQNAMITLGIQRVEVVDVDNSYGTMISPKFWEKESSLRLSSDLINP